MASMDREDARLSTWNRLIGACNHDASVIQRDGEKSARKILEYMSIYLPCKGNAIKHFSHHVVFLIHVVPQTDQSWGSVHIPSSFQVVVEDNSFPSLPAIPDLERTLD
jgi:hypothetical protein